MNSHLARSVTAIGMLLCPLASLHAQVPGIQTQASPMQTPVSIVQTTPARTDVHVGRKVHTLFTWKISDFRSPYFGMTLVWLEIRESDSLLSVEETNGTPIPNTPSDANVIAILNGGTWVGRYDSPTSAKRESGLVITSGRVLNKFTGPFIGGVLVACDDDVAVYDAASYALRFSGLPCRSGSALQTNAIVVKKGKQQPFPAGEKANRLAIGKDDDRILIAGAFTSFGTALSMADFAAYVAAAARKMGRNDLTALNLDSACSAQLVIPSLNRRFGCDSAGYSINRIVVRREP